LIIERRDRIKAMTVAGLILLVLVLLLAFSYPSSGTIKIRLISLLRGPLSRASRVSPVSGSPLETLRKDRDELEAELRRLSVEFDEVSRENERLKELLELKKSSKRRLVAARVTGKDISNWSKTVLIDRGTGDGIRAGMTVVSGGSLAGKIIETGTGISKVLLLVDPESRVGGLTQEGRHTGIVQGAVGGRMLMKYIEPDAEVKEGEAVITSGYGGTYPRGLVIGRTGGAKPDDSGLYLNARIMPEVDFSRLEEVMVIIE
jgi:rod shape-determining protein MreC